MPDPPEYVTGASTYRSPHVRLETKPWTVRREFWDGDGYRAVWNSGGGYERFRSWEYRPETPRDGKEDVYVYHHRLLAVAWLFPDGWTAEDILAELARRDVHHSAPEIDADTGIKWDNREACLHLRDHGRHGEITQAQMRAWAEDSKRDAYADPEPDGCSDCGEDAPLWVSPDFDGERCLDCALAANDGATLSEA